MYQDENNSNPKREATKTLYLEAKTVADVRTMLEKHTKHNIEFIEPLEGKHLEFEENDPGFKITEFK
ncbi:hypothetical protein IV48_GL000536 [Fructilactobacillus fructivorans]|nr:hypothetical protein FC73_GL000357 [Fructilactobacillus fructivorans]KRN13713.1 hypothetical protein IV37_GL000438 [Fructilactobacillus fructivorans]KRN39585.1 hypothetical protein IV51_GL000952 [Fructilactobacillus fructivorans]KRN43304.1 hypothetical protein IV48_GL000536 [Fructilactobacillus fructivorans]